jgi:hypothetical protein
VIVSHSRKFVFIKCRKTASTSVERFLHASLCAEDIWTPLSNPVTAGNNYYTAWPLNALASSSSLVRRLLGKGRFLKRAAFADHAGIAEIEKALGAGLVKTYFTFCFDRNPWDFAVSLYFHHRDKGRLHRVDFDEFVFTYPMWQNSDLYCTNRNLAVDEVFRYEELEQRLSELSQRLRLEPALLPADKTQRRPPGHYRQYYSQGSRDEVARRWHDTIRLLNYDF